MTPRQFLRIGGVLIVLVALAGFAGAFSTPNTFFYLTTAENTGHAVFGVTALLSAFALSSASAQRLLVAGMGAISALVGLYTLAVQGRPIPNWGLANLESPADLILHLAVGVWALATVFGNPPSNAND